MLMLLHVEQSENENAQFYACVIFRIVVVWKSRGSEQVSRCPHKAESLERYRRPHPRLIGILGAALKRY